MTSQPESAPDFSWDSLTRQWLATGLKDEDLYQEIKASLMPSDGAKSRSILSIIDHLHEDPIRRFSEVPDFDWELSHEEILTLQVCLFFPGVMTVKRLDYAAPEDLQELAEVTLKTSRDLLEISAPLHDLPLEGALATLGCRGGRYLPTRQEAINLGKRAVRIYRSLSLSDQGQWTAYLASALKSLGLALHAEDRKSSALRSLRLALGVFENANSDPEVNYDEEIGGLHHNLSNLYFELGDIPKMVEASEKACSILRYFVSDQPENYLPKLGHCLDNLATGLRHLGQAKAALSVTRSALQIWKSLASVSPQNYRQFLEEARLQMSYCLRESGRPREARLAAYRALKNQLFEGSPTDSKTLGLAFNQHAACCALSDQIDDAIKSFKNAHDHLQEAPHILARSQEQMSVLLSHAGRAEDALHYAKCAMDGYEERSKNGNEGDLTSDLAMAATNLAARLMTLGHLRPALQTARFSVAHYRKLAPDENSEDFDNAIKALLNLSTYVAQAGHPKRAMPHILRGLAMLRKAPSGRSPLLAKLLTNLSLRYFEIGHYPESIEASSEAVKLYRGLIETNPKTFRLSLGSALNNYALGCFQNQQEERGVEALTEALRILDELKEDKTKILDDVITIRRNEALRRMRGQSLEDYKAAHEILREALNDCSQLRSSFRSDEHRKRIQAYHRELHVWHIGLCLGLAKLQNDPAFLGEAFEISEGARARSLADLLCEVQVTPPGCKPELITKFHQLRRQLSELETHTWQGDDLETATMSPSKSFGTETRLLPPLETAENQNPEAYLQKAAQLRRRMEKERQEIQSHAPHWNPDQPLPPASLDQVFENLPDRSALIQFTIVKHRLVALALQSSDRSLVQLEFPKLTGKKLAELHTGWIKQRSALKLGQIKFREFAIHINRFIEELSITLKGDFEEFLCKIRGQTKRLILSPSGPLHQFPLHAFRLPDQTILGDAFEVSYIPSGSILTAISRHPHSEQNHTQLITNPTQDLNFADLEDQILQQRHHWQRSLHGRKASKASVLSNLSNASYLLFSGHSHFFDTSPDHSGLRLSDGTLSIRDLFEKQRLRNCQLAFLNGCESGFMKPDVTDDFVSLTTAFLYSGAKSVISTLWPIHDLASCLFSAQFNELHLNQKLPASEAFQQAIQWLRGLSDNGLKTADSVVPAIEKSLGTSIAKSLRNSLSLMIPEIPEGTPPFQSPAYWAAYTMSGVPWR